MNEFLWQKMYFRTCLNVSQHLLDGFICFGHESSVEKEGDLCPFSCDFVSFFPSADVMSERVKICKYSLQLLSI